MAGILSAQWKTWPEWRDGLNQSWRCKAWIKNFLVYCIVLSSSNLPMPSTLYKVQIHDLRHSCYYYVSPVSQLA
jgi:hypothetical protein